MTDMRTALVGWKKGMTSFAHTYVLEIEGSTAHFTRVGKGGAHWEPDYLAMGRAANGVNPYNRLDHHTIENVQAVAGAGLGQIAGDKILDKYRQELAENVEVLASQGRGAIQHKMNMSVSVNDIAAATLIDTCPGGTPPALRNLEGPHAELKIDGKRWFLFQLPETPPLADLIAAAAD